MSHTELYNQKGRLIYARGPMFQYTLCIEDAVGDLKGCVILSPSYINMNKAEMQIPLKDLKDEDFSIFIWEIKQFCLSHGWNIIEGYTTQRFGDKLILAVDDAKWTDEYIQVGENQKRKIVWKIGE